MPTAFLAAWPLDQKYFKQCVPSLWKSKHAFREKRKRKAHSSLFDVGCDIYSSLSWVKAAESKLGSSQVLITFLQQPFFRKFCFLEGKTKSTWEEISHTYVVQWFSVWGGWGWGGGNTWHIDVKTFTVCRELPLGLDFLYHLEAIFLVAYMCFASSSPSTRL